MFREAIQSRVSRLLGASLFLTTVAIAPSFTLDPINVPKLWVLAITAMGITGLLLTQASVIFKAENRPIFLAARALFLFMLVTLLISNVVFSQQFFGVLGRNTGLLTYFSFGTLFIASAIATNRNTFKPIIVGIAAAFGINAIYGFFQGVGKDPFKWTNPYSPVIGTLGNPNFAGAFLAMGISIALSYALAKESTTFIRAIAIFYIPIATFGILKSHAQQGVVVSTLSVGLVGYFFIRDKLKKTLFSRVYLLLGFFGAIFAVLGTLQKGPLSFLYKPSVTYRGDYWHAGLKMFMEHPWFGVGLDAYGDYYRSARTLEATLRRGPSIVSNAAHNVFIDIAATAGVLALIAYLAIIFLGLRAAWRIHNKNQDFNPLFVSIFVMWIGYLVQSVISINNIGLGIWGFVLPGLLISIDRWELEQKVNNKKNQDKKTSDFSGMAMVAGLALGGVVGFLPFNSDANFRHAIEIGDANKIYAAAQKWPSDYSRLMYAAQLFKQNKMDDKALSLVKISVKMNPRNFDGWLYLYNDNSTSESEKISILGKLKKLDPHNPDLAKLK